MPAAASADPGENWRERLVVGWSGMRGAISLAAALALTDEIAERELLIFITVGVIAVTLVGQGLTLAPLLRLLGIERDREWSPDEAIARLEAAQAALDRLDELEREERIGEERLRRMRELYRARFRRCMVVIGGEADEAHGTAQAAAHDTIERYSELRRELIGVERDGDPRAAQRGAAAPGHDARDPARPRPRGGAAARVTAQRLPERSERPWHGVPRALVAAFLR